MRFPRALAALAIAVAVGASLASCSTTVAVPAPTHADDPKCADVIVSLRSVQTLADTFDRVWTDSQSTAAWGSPTAVILACGVTPVVASTFPCQTVGGIDWVIDNSDPKYYRVTTFDRDPAVQVFIDLQQVGDAGAVLDRLSKSVSHLPKNTLSCTARPTS